MPVPKRRRSKSKSRIKTAHWKLDMPQLRPCPSCGALSVPHRACQACGTYKGRQVIPAKQKKTKES
ncbi:MAG: 50S ribosomal protein L32 [Candidatus Margulisiibacteriota bacterium]